MDITSLAIGICIGIIGGKAVKEIIVSIFPGTAKIFAGLSVAQRQLQKVLIAVSENNEVKKFIRDKNLKVVKKLL